MLINVNKFDYSVLDEIKPLNMRGGRKDKKKYYDVVTAFDIETTRLKDIEQSFMYIWQFQILDYTVYGRYWNEFIEFFALCGHFQPSPQFHSATSPFFR